MKKYLKIILIIIVVLAAAAAVAMGTVDFLKEEPTTVSETVTETTAEPVTVQTTTMPTTTETTIPAKPVIDLDSITIIDLYPLSLAGGSWDVKHCQGLAVDKRKGFVYYSYTTMLIKCDFEGNLVGSVSGIAGHLGDITYNEADGKVYCGYYSEKRTAFYAVIFDVDKITKMDMKPTSNVVRTVYLKDPYKYYKAQFKVQNQDGTEKTMYHRYGCSGIDAVTFGPDFSKKSKKEMLTVSCGIYSDNNRNDNNYQVLLQYDVTDWWDNYAKPYSASKFHTSGPEKYNGKYFVYTGNTSYGVQTMEYFDELNIWLLNCYEGSKPDFENYSLFAIDADVAPRKEIIKGQPKEESGRVLSLYQDGEHDKKNDIYGWYSTYGVQGVAYMGDGLFYIVRPYKNWTGTKTAICYLCVWAPDKEDPFELAAGIGNDYSISKKLRVETTASPTTKKPATTAPSTTKPKAVKPASTKPKTTTSAGQPKTTNNMFQGIASLFGKQGEN